MLISLKDEKMIVKSLIEMGYSEELATKIFLKYVSDKIAMAILDGFEFDSEEEKQAYFNNVTYYF